MEFKDTKTFQNLVNAFVGESQARMRYTFYAGVAKNEGHVNIQEIFLSTADNERAHAKVFYQYLQKYAGHQTNVFAADAEYPLNLRDTLANLRSAQQGEGEEVIDYNKAADDAEAEGFKDIALSFRKIAEVEDHHAQRYQRLGDELEQGKIYKKDQSIEWKCINCGYVHNGTEAPGVCPACVYPQGYFKPLPEVY